MYGRVVLMRSLTSGRVYFSDNSYDGHDGSVDRFCGSRVFCRHKTEAIPTQSATTYTNARDSSDDKRDGYLDRKCEGGVMSQMRFQATRLTIDNSKRASSDNAGDGCISMR